MTKFTVIYRESGESSPKRVVLKGADESSLRRECEGRGWQALLIRRANEWSSADLVLRAFTSIRFGVSTEELCAFCETMCTLWRAGVQVIQIIDICIREVGNAWFRERLQIVRRRMANGEDLASAMGDMRCSRAFPLRLRKRVLIGDRNGCIGNSIGRFNTVFKFERARQELINDMIALAIAVTECILVFGFIAMTVLPFNDTVAEKGACGPVLFAPWERFGMPNHPICLGGLFLGIASVVVILVMAIRKYATRITIRALRGKWREELHQRWRAQIEQLVCRGCGEEFREEDRSCLLQLGYCPRCGAKMKILEGYDFVYRTQTHWWRLCSTASKAMPEAMGLIASLVFSVLPSVALLMSLGAFGALWGIIVLLAACSLGWFIFRRVVIGGMLLCILCLSMSVVFVGILLIGGQHVMLLSLSFTAAVGLYVLLPLLILMVPSLRRWVQTCRDERMAFAVLDRCDMKIVVLPKKERPQCADSISGFVFAVWFHGIIGLLSVCLLTHALPSCQFEGHQSRFVQHGKY